MTDQWSDTIGGQVVAVAGQLGGAIVDSAPFGAWQRRCKSDETPLYLIALISTKPSGARRADNSSPGGGGVQPPFPFRRTVR